MEENLEVYFCDLCNASIPVRDLEVGDAVQVRGRTIGGCCLPALRRGESPRPAGGRASAIILILVAAVAGAALFLDSRLTEQMGEVDGAVARIERELGDQHQEVLRLEERLDATALRSDVGSVRDGLEDLAREGEAREARLRAALQGVETTLGALQARIRELHLAQDAYQALITRLEEESRAIGQALAELEVAPVVAPAERSVASEVMPMDAATAGLPAEVQRLLPALADEDPGTRFEAVDELLRSGNPAAREHLLPLVDDADMFVRRLTVEGLREFRHPSCVDALLAALDDPEPIVRDTAYDSVCQLTGQVFPFDADGSRDARLAARRRWQEWWDENRDSF